MEISFAAVIYLLDLDSRRYIPRLIEKPIRSLKSQKSRGIQIKRGHEGVFSIYPSMTEPVLCVFLIILLLEKQTLQMEKAPRYRFGNKFRHSVIIHPK